MKLSAPMDVCCQSCEIASATQTEGCDNPDEPYLLCDACHDRLLSRSLRPLEWYNLAKRHGWFQYLLHDDFYDEDGTAAQPEAEIEDEDKIKIPKFEDICKDPKKLLDWSITRWHLKDPEVASWAAISPNAKLRVLADRFVTTSNGGIHSCILEILGETGDSSHASLGRVEKIL